MSAPLAVVAVAARTPLGFSAESAAAAVRAGISGFAEFPFIMLNGEPVVVCADPEIDSTIEGRDRLAPMINTPLTSIVDALTSGRTYQGRCYILLVLPEARPGFSDADADSLAKSLSVTYLPPEWRAKVSIAGRGHAGRCAPSNSWRSSAREAWTRSS